jgi:hypothetical protein
MHVPARAKRFRLLVKKWLVNKLSKVKDNWGDYGTKTSRESSSAGT